MSHAGASGLATRTALSLSLGAGRSLGLVVGVEVLGAGQIEGRLGGQVLANSKLDLVVGVGVTEIVPESRGLVEELAATNFIPVVLGVLDAGLGLIPVGASNRPASLGNPDGLSTSSTNGSFVCAVEKSSGVLDVVALAAFVEWVLVNAKEVNGVDDGLDGGVGPSIPSVDVTDRNLAQVGTLESLLEIINEAQDGFGGVADATLVLDAGDRVTVKILTADGDTNDKISELAAILRNSLLQGANLLVDVVSARGPSTEEDVSLGVDGSFESLDGVILGVSLDVGVQANSVEGSGGALKTSSGLELGLEILLELGRSIGESGTRVEAEIVVSGVGGESQSTGNDGSRNTHVDYYRSVESSKEVGGEKKV